VHAVELQHGAQFASIDHLLDATVGGLPPPVVPHLHGDAGTARGVGHAFRVGHRQGERLLDEHVLPRIRDPNRDVRMGRVGGRDQYPVDAGIGEHLVEVFDGSASVLLGERGTGVLGPRVAGDHVGDA
jgi:hypothetical protein